MLKYTNIFLLIVGLYIVDTSQMIGQIKVKYGANILPNGKFAHGEWGDATDVKLPDKLNIFMKQDSLYLYVGVQFIDTMHTGIDLYIAESKSSRKKLHVSAALGEMDFTDVAWSDWKWGANDLWVANSVGQIVEDGKQKVVPLEGFEFQIHKSLLPGKKWLTFLHLKRPELIFPTDGTQDNVINWMMIEL